jgi:hypothetical protein
VWNLTIPANAKGWLSLNQTEAAKYKLQGAPLTESTQAEGVIKKLQGGFELESGSYTFTVEM